MIFIFVRSLLLVALLLVHFTFAKSVCPNSCECDDHSIRCYNVNSTEFTQIFEKTETNSKLIIQKCSTPIGKIDGFPKNFRLRSLEISNCGITSFGSDAFKYLGNDLVVLKLMDNKLTSMPLLKNLKKLEVLNLKRNLIDTVPEGAFNGMEKFLQLKLKGNKICKLPSKTFNEVKGSLELLDLSSNCLSSVPAPNLRSSTFLKYLDLSDNQIVTLKDLEFMNLPELREIRLNNNRISHISLRAFVNVPALTDLYIKNNLLTEIDPIMLQSFKSLNVIDLSENNLQKIPSFKDMTELKTVYLYENNILRIDTLTFSSNPKLQMISLQNNKISLIARNSFDSLGSLTHLLLNNNSLQAIAPGIFDGMPNLIVLGLSDNSIGDLTSSSFSSLVQLGSLDLSNNNLQKISTGTFSAQKKLFWLDLSNNNITLLENGAFSSSVATILLNGNELNCDTALDWFITYLVQRNVRTFLPRQQEISCAAPPQFKGVRIKDLMIKKANDTMAFSIKQVDTNPQQGNSFLSSFLPAFTGTGGQNSGSSPILSSLSQAIPSLRNLPGWSENHNGPNSNDPSNRNTNDPLSRSQLSVSDVSSLINSIPNLVVNLPGYGNIDLRKIHPKMIEHVLNGGSIPGVPKEAMDSAVKQIMQHVYAATAQTNQADNSRNLPSGGLKTEKYLPQFVLANGIQGHSNSNGQIEVGKDFNPHQTSISNLNGEMANRAPLINPELVKMFNMLPPNYNISKLPKEVIQAAMKGEMPDLTLLPSDLQLYIRDNLDKFVGNYGGTSRSSIEEILRKLPKFDQMTDLQTFSPYDINTVDADLVVKGQTQDLRFYIAISLGLVSTITLCILVAFCIFVRKNKVLKYGENDL